MTSKLSEHFAKMQDMVARYLAPEPYVGHDSVTANALSPLRDDLFIDDMIYMLDGPEQREAQADG